MTSAKDRAAGTGSIVNDFDASDKSAQGHIPPSSQEIQDRLQRAREMVLAGQGGEALDLIRSLPHGSRDILIEVRKLASLALDKGDKDAAVELVRIIVDQIYKDPQAHNNLGVVMLLAGRPKEAYWELDLARQLDEQNNPLYTKNLAHALALCGQWSQAATLLDNILESMPAEGQGEIKGLLGQCRQMTGEKQAGQARDLGLNEFNHLLGKTRSGVPGDKDVLILVPSGCYVEECCVGPNKGLTPGGALLLAAYLRKKGYNPTVTSYGGGPETVVDKPKAAVFYAPWMAFASLSLPMIRQLKNAWPEVPTIMVMYESMADFEIKALEMCPELDYAVLPSEKEISVGVILDHGHTRCPGGFGEKSGIVFRDEDGRPASGGKRPQAKDLYHLPYMGSELELFLRRNPHEKFKEATIIFQRGCPQACTYCPMRGSRFRYRDPEAVAAEIAAGNRLLGRSGMLSLEHFKYPEPLDRLCDLLLAQGTFVTGGVGARSEYVTDVEFLKKMGRAGIQCVYLGMEGATEEMRLRLKKPITDDHVATAIQNVRQAGLTFTSAFITGLPWEDDAYYHNMYGLVKELISIPECVDVHLSKLIPYPGLPATAALIEEGVVDRVLEFGDWQALRTKQHYQPGKHLSIDELDQRFDDMNALIWAVRHGRAVDPPSWAAAAPRDCFSGGLKPLAQTQPAVPAF